MNSQASPVAGSHVLLLRWSAFLCLAAGIIFWLGPWLLRADLFPNDAAHHVFWLYRFADPGLFPADLSIQYFSSDSVAPLGYRALYAAFASWVDVAAAAEWLSVLLLCSSAVLAWMLGRSLGLDDRELAGLLAVTALMLLLPVVDLHPAMALQRTFALPLTLLCLWALVSGRYEFVGISWLVAALFYPVIVPVLGLTAAAVFLRDLLRDRRMPPNWLWNGASGVAAVSFVWLGSGTPEGIGPMVTIEQARLMPEFGPGGRQQLFGTGLIGSWLRGHRTGIGWSPWAALALATALAIVILRDGIRRIPYAAWCMAAAGLGLWFAARQMLFDLYLPNRHSRWALTAFAIVVFALAARSAVRLLARAGEGGQPVSSAWSKAVAVAAPLLVAAALAPTARALLATPVDRGLEDAYAFLQRLPRDTLVVAHPDLADFVPLRSQRSVLASSEGAIAFMQGYYGQYRPRIETSLKAAYATSWPELDAILSTLTPCVVLTNTRVWERNRYDAGYERLVEELWRGGIERGFVLKPPAPDRVLFQSGGTYVVSCPAASADVVPKRVTVHLRYSRSNANMT